MTDTKDLLAQASAALDAERAANKQVVDSLGMANVSLQAQLDTANATIADLQAQLDPWAKVDKTGKTDVTAQVQLLISKGYPIPAGRYLINPVPGLVAVRAVVMDANAVLIAKPNSAPRYCVLSLGDGVSLKGGQIIGDRLAHTYTTGSTHEWGYGLKLGKGCRVENVTISQCAGDGICAGADGAELVNVVSTQNRRQAISVFGVTQFKATDCKFTNTGALGADPGAPNGPWAGADVEPDSGDASGIEFIRCTFADNQSAGFLAWTRSGTGSAIGVTLTDCTFARNANGINAKSLSGQPVVLTVRNAIFDHNRASAAKIEAGASLDLATYTVIGMTARYALQGAGTIKASGATYA